jgi:hypothetical protein
LKGIASSNAGNADKVAYPFKEFIIQGGKYLSDEDVELIAVEMLAYIHLSNQMIEDFGVNEHEDEENQAEEFKNNENSQVDAQTVFADVIGALYRNHPQKCADIAKRLYNEILKKALSPESSEARNRLGLFIVCDMIEFLVPAGVMVQELPAFIVVILRFSGHPAHHLR